MIAWAPTWSQIEEVNGILEDIGTTFESRYGFVTTLDKGGQNKKMMKRVFSDGRINIEVPVSESVLHCIVTELWESI